MGLTQADEFRDYRGVVCPSNYIRVTVDLIHMECGKTLEVLLDDGSPAHNVPFSLVKDGQTILQKAKLGNHWSIVIRKDKDYE